jgi:hypothetical protein
MSFHAEITGRPIAKFVVLCGVSGLFRLCLEQKQLMVISEDRSVDLKFRLKTVFAFPFGVSIKISWKTAHCHGSQIATYFR